jgi:predicted metal-dependent peptidase
MANISSKDFEEIFQKIRINFLFNHPFLSVLALSIPTTFESNPNSAFTTNGSKITIDLEKLSRYSEDEIVYLYAHTLLHIVLKHPYRAKQRDKKLWNQASDIVINLILDTFSNVGTMPKDEIFDSELKDKCVEEVYEILEKEEQEENDDSGSDNEDQDSTVKTTPDKNGNKKSFIYDESKLDLDTVPDESKNSGYMEKLDGIIIQALTIAQKTSNKYSGMNIEIDTLIKPDINLHDILKEYLISSFFEKQSTFNRPNRRFVSGGLYLPGTKKSDELIELYIALDSSSSVTMDEYKKFLGVVSEVCEGFYEYKITILPFDRYVKTEHIIEFDSFNPIEDEKLFIPKSDGGTNFNEVLRYLKTTDIRADKLLMVLTDGEFDINESLVCQTLFIISSKKNLAKFKPYGRVIEFSL